MRRALLLIAALVLAACDPGQGREAFTDSRPPPSLSPRFLAPEGWAWGVVQAEGQPQLRYGVSSPVAVGTRAQVLIVPAYGESGEVWFETARQLNARGYAVWVLERAGQGGSGRYLSPHDLGHTDGFEAGAEAVRSLIAGAIRPDDDVPLILLGAGDAALTAVMAAQGGAAIDAMILSGPDFRPQAAPKRWESLASRVGLARAPAPGWRAWSREAPDDHAAGVASDPWRGKVRHAWQTANPDLRLTGPSLGWAAAQSRALAQILAAPALSMPVLILGPAEGADAAQTFCATLAACEYIATQDPGTALHLGEDSHRTLWFETITDHLAQAASQARAVRPAPGA
ncbi:serine aminopeptidase domain-containing protein [Phenylobacterium sp.]|uniref:serine aminopeptidase domain-containing protein n=1 Tax=Phenylobacterium sp. TaxID=1871053 RepID=UPI00273070E5|nr:alpha/beta hydrolase [Phenylobacterium sp.]MDP1618495.1 alpha/beta hydrolase [Phenylobacterium sp.]MDP1989168.1 alpha/beta hydrolase [Phenylobacterium sp.]